MNKFSVIIPTIQRTLRVLQILLQVLMEDVCVDEILVINNKPKVPLVLPKCDKIRIITPAENIYVNPSWNLGISECRNENFAIINDDILVCSGFISSVSVSDVFNSPETGLIGAAQGLDMKFYKKEEEMELPQKYSNLQFIPLTRYMSTGDWGSVILGKKSNYYMIPNELKIIYGDNYLLYKNQINGKINYKVSGMPFNHLHSFSSSSSEFSNIIANDMLNQKKYIVKKQNDNKNIDENRVKYKLDFRKNVCFLEYCENNKKSISCFKKDMDAQNMEKLLSEMIPEIEKLLLCQIIDRIISQNKVG